MTTFIRTASTTTFQFTAQGDQLIVPAGGHIWVEAAGGVFTYDSNSIYVNGEIDSGYSGIYVQSNAKNNTSEIIVGSSGNVVGSTAFWLDGNATIQNAGQISGGVGIYSTTGPTAVTLYNTGSITGLSYSYSGANGIDTIINSGRISGDVSLNGGNDFYDGRGGSVLGTVYGGNGNDVMVGGSAVDKFADFDGNNWIVGGGGDDTITLGTYSGGTTIAFGGEANGPDNSGNDSLYIVGNASTINLNGNYVSDQASGVVTAWINGFENATGTFYADVIVGTAGNNVINGGGGADWLVGGGGQDRFVFDSAGSDTIADFSKDIIDLGAIDANTGLVGDQAFIFHTTHGNNAAGELVFTNYGSGGVIQLYTNADNIVDGTIFVAYASGAASPIQSDFIL